MWSYVAAAKRSARPLLASSSLQLPPRLRSTGRTVQSCRYFASGKDGGDKQNQNRNKNNNHNQGNAKGRRPKKQGYNEKFLDPAARGELKKHQSGIPKLAGRRPKGNSVKGADVLPEKEEEWGLEDGDIAAPVEFRSQRKERKPAKSGSIAKGSALEELSPKENKEVMDFINMYHALGNTADVEKYYWDEVDYDQTDEAKKHAKFEELMAEATRDADGNLVVEVEDDVFAMFDEVKDEPKKEDDRQQRPRGGFGDPANDPNFQFVMERLGIEFSKTPPGPEYDAVTPLDVQGTSMSDFVEAMLKHPTKYTELRYNAQHPESTREPLPDMPPSRKNPSKEFLEANVRFIYVWGLPPLTVNGNPGDIENPVDSLEIQKTVAGLFDVSPEDVSAASLSSAFIGFPTAADQRVTLAVGPMQDMIESPVTMSQYSPDSGKQFAMFDGAEGSLVLFSGLPSGTTPFTIANSLFPTGSEVGELYGNIDINDIVMLSPNSAVVKYESKDVADHLIGSDIAQQRLVEFGQHRIRYSKARRELNYSGFHGGPGGQDRLRKLGSRMVVDGDMPTKDFFLSHAGTLMLRNLDPSVTKENISKFFQPYCTLARDLEGSVEFVTCHKGLPTGKAYVGFDELGEAEAAFEALKASGGRITSGNLGPTSVVVRSVKELDKMNREKRQTRSDEELLESLHNWEQYVDPADVDELVQLGISKDALDEALRAIRYQNPTFASLDQALRDETTNPDKDVGGMYRELVQEYIATLKECVSTPENPGVVYESLFFPDEPIDMEIFDDEVDRQEELAKKREIP
ncbi:unnamed protein product [Cylindrotheca closterium]|uniref:RRM domain-containing protein n=1 Tax=Cylindrotheca closterium TaxID=2856 RepID=A0AAD2FI88_9STRA|nr:unnamed protein product [Cylindrotheca closterium]